MNWLQQLDVSLFEKFQTCCTPTWLENLAWYFAHPLFYAPVFIFLIVLIALDRGRTGKWLVFFQFGGMVVAYQIATSLSDLILAFTEDAAGGDAFSRAIPWPRNLPDWATAALAAGLFTALRFQNSAPRWLQNSFIVIPWLAGTARVVVGECYPLSVFAGYLCGILVGWLMHRFSDNFRLVVLEDA